MEASPPRADVIRAARGSSATPASCVDGHAGNAGGRRLPMHTHGLMGVNEVGGKN